MTASAQSIVAVLALVNQRLMDLAIQLRGHQMVRSVSVAVTPRRYPAGDRVECYVDAELANGRAVGCWLEARIDDGSWIIDSSIRCNSEEGENELLGLPSRFAVDDDELVAELDGASSALVETARSLDFGDL